MVNEQKKKAQQKKAYKKWYKKYQAKRKLEQHKIFKKEVGRDTHIVKRYNQFVNKHNNNIAFLYTTSTGYYYIVKYNDFRKEYTSPIFKTKQKAIDDLYIAL